MRTTIARSRNHLAINRVGCVIVPRWQEFYCGCNLITFQGLHWLIVTLRVVDSVHALRITHQELVPVGTVGEVSNLTTSQKSKYNILMKMGLLCDLSILDIKDTSDARFETSREVLALRMAR